MHKHWASLAVLIPILILGLVSAGCAPERPQEIIAVLGIEESEITEIKLRDGNTGEAVSLTSETEIDGFMAFLNEILLTKSPDKSLRAGYAYAAQIYKGDHQAAVIIFAGDRIKVDNTYYDLSSAFDAKKLSQFF